MKMLVAFEFGEDWISSGVDYYVVEYEPGDAVHDLARVAATSRESRESHTPTLLELHFVCEQQGEKITEARLWSGEFHSICICRTP